MMEMTISRFTSPRHIRRLVHAERSIYNKNLSRTLRTKLYCWHKQRIVLPSNIYFRIDQQSQYNISGLTNDNTFSLISWQNGRLTCAVDRAAMLPWREMGTDMLPSHVTRNVSYPDRMSQSKTWTHPSHFTFNLACALINSSIFKTNDRWEIFIIFVLSSAT